MTTTAANPNTCEATCSPYEVLGWAWTEACSRLDKGEDPRKIEMPAVMAAFHRDFPEMANEQVRRDSAAPERKP